MTPPKLLPPHYFLLSLAAMAALYFADGSSLLPGRWPLVGILPICLGLALALWGSRLFSKAGTNIVPFTESTAMVVEGAFAFSRNPMYLGMILALAGVALLLNATLPWLVVAGFSLLIRFGFVRVEELLMEQTFGEDYTSYKTAVRRWI